MGERIVDIQQPLLIERVAELYQFDRLTAKIPSVDIYAPYLVLAVFFFIDFIAVNSYKMLTGFQHILVVTPTVVAGPIGIFLAAVGIRYMASSYSAAIGSIYQYNQGPDAKLGRLDRLVSMRTKWIVLGIAVVSEYAFIIFINGVDTIIRFEGPAGLVNVLFVHEFGYLPFVAEFAVMYFAVHFFVPKRINERDINLFQYDPRNMGGFGGIGQLLKRSYYLYTAGLLLYLMLAYGPFIFCFETAPAKPEITTALFFSAAWFVGILSIGYSIFRMHDIMAAQKEQRMQELEQELQEVVENPHDVNSSAITNKERFRDIQRRLEEVRSTKEYPATFAMWSQIGISVLLP